MRNAHYYDLIAIDSNKSTGKILINISYLTYMKNTIGSAHLDLLRTVAAWQVCIHHIKNLFFVDYQQVQSKNFFNQAFYYFSRFGHQSVIIFFVLSGLFIASSVIKQNDQDTWSWSKYFITRLSRLYIVLVPALIIGGFFDWLGIYLLGTQNIYDGKTLEQTIITYPVIDRLNINNFLGNLAFLQSFKVPTFGSNSPLWSLSYEFWYYILFPLIFFALTKKGLILNRIIYSASFVLILNFIGLHISLSFLIWLLGVAIIYINQSTKLRHTYRGIASILTLFVLLFSISFTLFIPNEYSFFSDLLVGIASSIFIYILVQYDSVINKDNIYPKAVHFLANFSYTLYLVHMPFLVFINALILKGNRWQPDSLHILFGLILFIITVSYSFIISCFTEAKTNIVRNWLVKHLPLKC